MKTSIQFKTILSGLILSLLIGLSSQSAHGQFVGAYYYDTTHACVNILHDGVVGWSQPGGSYATGDSIDFYIDWGDGNNNSYPNIQMLVSGSAYASTNASHIYATAGTYTINVTATDEFSNVFVYSDSVIVEDACGHVYGGVLLDNGDNI